MKTFSCDRCGFLVFFENTRCRHCGSTLGFIPEELCMATFEATADGSWRRIHEPGAPRSGERRTPCRNYAREQVCNWTVAGEADALCSSCRHTEITPALRSSANREHWIKLESAKRRLFYSLFQLGLPVPERGEEGGLVFRFIEDKAPHTTPEGRASHVITLKIAEADDVLREARRTQRHEPRRTLLGHFRHEIGHYYRERLIAGSPRLDAFRALFGDERRDYADASATYYTSGPAEGWFDRYITAYASMHPREDWAETWAHYLLVIDALDTAAHWGFALHSDQEDGGPADLPCLRGTDLPFREVLIKQWLPLSQFLNGMSRSVGHNDAFPSIVEKPVLDKICFVNDVVAASRTDASGGHEPGVGERAAAARRGRIESEQPTATGPDSEVPGAAPSPLEDAPGRTLTGARR